MVSEENLIAAMQLLAGVTLAAIGICRINRMLQARWSFRVAYIGITVAAIGLAIASVAPANASPWQPALLLVSVALLLIDTRNRWADGPPADSGSRRK